MTIKRKLNEIAKELDLKSADLTAVISQYTGKVKKGTSALELPELIVVFEYFTQKFATEEFVLSSYQPPEEPVAEEAAPIEEIDIEELNKPIEKTARVVDTRTANVDLEKFDTDKIEEMVKDNIFDESTTQKQKIKKGGPGKSSKKQAAHAEEKQEKKPKKEEEKKILIPDEITVGELAERMKQPASELIKRLMMLGVMAAITQTIDYDTAEMIAQDMKYIVEREIILTDEDILFHDVEDAPEDLQPRSPVVVVMGHVDHGKTRLLDSIRKTHVIETEAGGITQHIGAYRVTIGDRQITFLDTPGHEAFTAMRARGAQATDIAILVVAADDGIMPQTIEAINHAKAAGVSIIVAINKIDKEEANPDNVKQQLTEHGLIPEEWGGDTICVPISALRGDNIDTLLEMVLLTADMKELKANPNRMAKGIVIEAKLDKGRGPVATLLVQNGTLNVGDAMVAGTAFGRIRAMIDDRGKRIKKAGPSVPVEVLGLNEVPEGGNQFYAVTDEKMAKNVISQRKQKIKDEYNKSTEQVISLDALFDQIKQGEVKELNIIIKADVQGSVEAMRTSLERLSNDEVRIKVIHGAVGTVTESDIMLAQASRAIIVGFNVRPTAATMESAEQQNVEIRLYRVIYHAIEEMEQALKGMLDPIYTEVVYGHAEVRQTYKISGVGTIAGCYVTDGKIVRNSEIRLVRDGIVVHEGSLNSLKRFKDDVKEVANNYECGLGIERYNDIKEGDVIECFVMEEVKR